MSQEEKYFRELEMRRAEERARQQELINQDAERKTHLMRCPKCGGHLEALQQESVELDRCKDCQGIWLDAGELEQLTERERGLGIFALLTRRR